MDAADVLKPQLLAIDSAAREALQDAECSAALVRSYNFVGELALLSNLLKGNKTEDVFKLGLKEYQFAALANSIGLYRQSFSALRLTLELCLSAIEFSANERRLRTWLRSEADLNWQNIVDIDNGIFSKSFTRIFFEELATSAPQYRGIVEKLYRECSEYVHGNASTHISLPESISFSRDVFLTWCEKASTARLCIIFAFVARFCEDLTDSQRDLLRPIVAETLGHIEAIRSRFGGPVGA